MGISYYVCSKCGEAFPDCGDYKYCDCGELYCGNCMGDVNDVLDENEDETGETDCPVCRGEVVHDSDVLAYLLKKYKLSKEDIVNEMKGVANA